MECSKCNKILKTKQSLKNHESKCLGLDKLQCELCKNTFKNRQSKYRHKKNKICQQPSKITNNTTNNTNCNNTTNINVTINIDKLAIPINSFGRENTEYLYDNTLVKKCIFQGFAGLLKFIKVKHFNNSHPENKNISKDNKRDKFIQVYNGKIWENKLKDVAIEDLLTNCTILLNGIIDETIEESNGKELKQFLNQIQEYLSLMKTLNLTCDDEYLSEKVVLNKKFCINAIDEFIYHESDSTPLKHTQNKYLESLCEIEKLKQKIIDMKQLN